MAHVCGMTCATNEYKYFDSENNQYGVGDESVQAHAVFTLSEHVVNE